MPRDIGAIARAADEDLPPVMNYLEQQAPQSGFKFRTVSIADISAAAMFRNLAWARVEPDPARWPRTMAWVRLVTELPALQTITAAADRLLRLPPDEAAGAMSRLGFAVTPDSMGGAVARRGPMTV